MSLDLILKDIQDQFVRENFSRLLRFINDQTILNGVWKFYIIEVSKKVDLFKFKHNLKFIPKDVIVLSIDGDKNVDFRYDLFTNEHIFLSTEGACVIRLLLGRYEDFREPSLRNLDQVKLGEGDATPETPVLVPRLIQEFNTDIGTQPGDLVVLTGADTVTKIPNNNYSTIPNGVFGIGYSKSSDVLINVLFMGLKGGFSGFTPGKVLFISAGGGLTHTPPITGVLQQIGFATTATDVFINMMQPSRRS